MGNKINYRVLTKHGSKNTKVEDVLRGKFMEYWLTIKCHRWSLIRVRLLYAKLFAKDLDLIRT